MTNSTVASTVEIDNLSFEYENQTNTSVTTADSQSRTSTVKNTSKPLRTITSGVPDIPPSYSQIIEGGDDIVIKEIGGPLRSPGVGVAF